MIVPTEVRPGTTHLPGNCLCGHTHEPAPPVLRGPAHRLASNVGYVVTDGTLYQQVRHRNSPVLAIDDGGGQVWQLSGGPAGFDIETIQIVRTVGTIERPAA